MKPIRLSVCVLGALAASLLLRAPVQGNVTEPGHQQAQQAVIKGLRWLAAVQGADGGWGQDGGGTSTVRAGQNLETTGNDVANTAVATLALLRSGPASLQGEYGRSIRRGVQFVLQSVENSPTEGLAVTSITGTQIQRKLGPFIDTFLSSMLLSEVDGVLGDPQENRRVRRALEKCITKIEKNQQQDGSWNISGGWAPILGTSIASRSLYAARLKGVPVSPQVMGKVSDYTKKSAQAGPVAAEAAAGVALYQGAQALEQLSRTDADRRGNDREIKSITDELSSARFVRGFGSMGGEEFFSYLNISDSLRRAGGEPWSKWNNQIKPTLVKLQNEDGTWAGHHCITGRVAVTSAAVLTLTADQRAVQAKAR